MSYLDWAKINYSQDCFDMMILRGELYFDYFLYDPLLMLKSRCFCSYIHMNLQNHPL